MKKKSLLLILLMTLLVPWAANAQEQTVITCYPPTQEYATGYTDGTTKTSGEMQCISNDGVRGWMKFDVSSIPAGATIDAIKIYFYCNSTSNSYVKLTSAGELDPATASASELYEAIGTTTPNYYTSTYMSGFSSTGWKNFSMSDDAKTNLQTNGLTNGYFTVGFYEYETSSYTDYYMYASGYEDANKPYLQVTCTVPVSCSKPTLSNDVPTTTTTATLSWTPSSAEQTLFDIYWSEDNTAPTELTTPSAANQTGTSYTIPGLTPGKTYYAWIRGNCGTASSPDYTFWTNGVSFDTQCQASAALGYDEKFDTYTSTSGFLPNCWRRINESTSTYSIYPYIYNSGAYSGSNCLRFYVYGSSTTTTIADQYAVLPEMTGMAGLQITFMAKGYNTGNTFKIGQMSDPTDVSTFNEIATKSLTTTYEECNFILTDKGNYIAILMEKPTSSLSTTIGVYIDNISIHTPPTCIKPTDLAVTASGLNATVTWESEESQWQVARATSATADPLENIIATVNAKTFTDENLPLADYYYWVRSYCSASDQSDWVGPVSVHIGYCLPSINNVDGNGFTNITYGTGENIVNNDVPKTTYADYTYLVGAVQAGVEATVTITNSTGYDYGTIIWVDLNNSLSFEDSEIVFAYNIPNQTTPYAATFIIPATQTVGDYVMRIGAADSSFDSYVKGQTTTPPSACFSTNWGTCQDYTLRVLEKPSCITPTGLALSLDGQKISATWNGEASTYNIDINGTVTNNVTSPYKFDVELETTYTVKVQANCPGDETSDWSNPASLTTPPCWGGHVIEYTLNDSWNDGWESANITVIEGCDNIVATLTTTGGSVSGSLTLCGEYYRFVYNSGTCCDSEHSWVFTEGGSTLFSGTATSSSDGQVLYTIGTSIPIPTDLDAGTPGKHDAELSWTENGTAEAWQICLDGDEEHLIEANTNPFTLENLDAQTDYTVKVRAYIDATHQSCWSDELDFTTEVACQAPTDFANETPGTNSVVVSWTENGTATEWQIYYVDDMGVEGYISVYENPFTWDNLNQDTEYSAVIRAVCGGDDGSSQWSNAINFSTAIACARPTNLTETGITTKSATLSWEGTSDSYVLQYRPWNQVGTDQLATGTFVTYNYDLSGFTGTGSIAIRHYDVSDMFRLNVDDIVVRNASDEIVYFEDFENGTIPSNITNMDLDGDGYVWGIQNNGQDTNGNDYCIGNYCASSASYVSGTALFPDNWMIISGIEFGGSLSFAARGQDPQWPAENFAVYVSLESDIVEVPVAGTSYEVKGLQPNTPYAWQVYGICGTDHSRTVSSFFKTQDDRLVFATNGNWNVLANWTDINGDPATALPTKDNNVRIDADANIPAGYVAEANKATINGGSITIAEGGQLKHASASLAVTLNKGITGYGDVSNKSNYYFISTPFSGVTLIGSNTWSHITNLEDNTYDLYGFDATQAGAEWRNWKSTGSENYSVFQSGSNAGLKPTYGYLYANSDDIDLDYDGTAGPTNVNPTYSITYDPTSTDPFNGFVLVGNPFTCNAYVTFTPAGGAPTEIDFYVMNAEGNGFDLSETNVTLAPMQGAFFWADADGDVTFSSEMPGSKALAGALNINLVQSGKDIDQARIRFGKGMQLAKASFRDNSSKLYIPQDDKNYAVVYTEAEGSMPLNFKAETTGNYTISFKLDGANIGYLHLFDKLTGNDVNLLADPTYSFVGSPRDNENRFIVKFSDNSGDDIFAYQSGDEIIVNGEGELQIFDVMGRFVGNMTVNGSERISASSFANGVYVFRMVGNEVKTQKIVVR